MTVTVELSDPSEYTPNGDPQWNCYPFVRVDNDHQILLGARSEWVYTINPAEARALASALLAAAGLYDS